MTLFILKINAKVSGFLPLFLPPPKDWGWVPVGLFLGVYGTLWDCTGSIGALSCCRSVSHGWGKAATLFLLPHFIKHTRHTNWGNSSDKSEVFSYHNLRFVKSPLGIWDLPPGPADVSPRLYKCLKSSPIKTTPNLCATSNSVSWCGIFLTPASNSSWFL